MRASNVDISKMALFLDASEIGMTCTQKEVFCSRVIFSTPSYQALVCTSTGGHAFACIPRYRREEGTHLRGPKIADWPFMRCSK